MHTNPTRRGQAAPSAPRSPCARALVLTTLHQVDSNAKALQQDNYNIGSSGNGTDDGTYGIGSGKGGDGNENIGSDEKVRRAHTPLLHSCTHACKHSTAAPASACLAFGHCAKHKPPGKQQSLKGACSDSPDPRSARSNRPTRSIRAQLCPYSPLYAHTRP